MHRHPSVQPCRKRVRSGSIWFRTTRIIGYLGLALAALSSTLLFPYFLSIFRPHGIHSEPYELQKQGRVDDLIWTEQRSPYLSRNVQSRERKDLLDFKKEPSVELKLRESLQGSSDSNSGKTFSMEFKYNHYNRQKNMHRFDGWNLVNGGDFKKLWKPQLDRGFEPCVSPQKSYSGYTSRGYLLVHANGGLNQMRAGICDMVAVAWLINATLVIPELDKRSFWQDSSIFSDVFDEEYFIKALEKDVPVVKKLPKVLLSAPRANKQFRSWSGAEYYKEEIARLWENYKVIRASKSDSRLANNNLPSDIQKLRCRVHYDALRFAPAIEALGKKLLERMRSDGSFISLHLRYEKDMLAFSGCTHGLSDPEIEELTMIRENTLHWKVKLINSTEQRVKGLCPLTPKEVGIFLQALGYPSSTRIYVAAGEIYGGNSSTVELRNRFPNLMCKETVATREELAPFHRHASQMAALDYIVSVESDVFVPSFSGNMARAVEGHRRFLGHRKTISPDRRRLVGLFNQLDSGLLQEGKEFSSAVIEMHSKRQGAPRKRKGPLPGSKGKERFRTEEAFYTNPLPDCMCQKRSLALDAKNLAHDRAHRNSSFPIGSGDIPKYLIFQSI